MAEGRGRGVLAGHMARALGAVRKNLWLVDIVVEVADARAPMATRNPQLDTLLTGKARVLVLARADLAAEAATRRWLSHFAGKGIKAIAVDAVSGAGVERLRALLQEGRHREGSAVGEARAMVVGVPNVGKSSLINRLAGRARARTGALPGITRGKQWIRVGNTMLLDLPGILPPFIRSRSSLARLAALGVVGVDACPSTDAAVALIDAVRHLAPQELEAAYGLASELGDPEAVLEEIGRRRGCLVSGGRVDLERAADVVLKDFRLGRLGRITLEAPPDGGESTPAVPPPGAVPPADRP